MLELFLSALEDQLGLIVDPPLAPITRMGIISQEITRITSSGLTKRASDVLEVCDNFTKARDGKCFNCGHAESAHR